MFGLTYFLRAESIIGRTYFELIPFELILVMLPSLMVSEQSFDYFLKQLLVIVVTLMSSS